jgi:hypothetical protein
MAPARANAWVRAGERAVAWAPCAVWHLLYRTSNKQGTYRPAPLTLHHTTFFSFSTGSRPHAGLRSPHAGLRSPDAARGTVNVFQIM